MKDFPSARQSSPRRVWHLSGGGLIRRGNGSRNNFPAAKAIDETYEERQERLTACLEKLPEAQRDLLRQRYADGLSLQAIAESVRRTANAVAQTLFRVRRTLIECVTRLAEGGAS